MRNGISPSRVSLRRALFLERFTRSAFEPISSSHSRKRLRLRPHAGPVVPDGIPQMRIESLYNGLSNCWIIARNPYDLEGRTTESNSVLQQSVRTAKIFWSFQNRWSCLSETQRRFNSKEESDAYIARFRGQMERATIAGGLVH